jgi:hypothetical protein
LTAPHGGILRESTSSLMATAQGRACAYVNMEKAAPPSRWQETHRSCTILEISRFQVIFVVMMSWAWPRGHAVRIEAAAMNVMTARFID